MIYIKNEINHPTINQAAMLFMRQGYEVYNLKKAIFIDGGEKARAYQAKYSQKIEGKE
jgi:hypothetical protein